MKETVKAGILCITGGAVYVAIEIAWRGHSHWSMFALGGLMFVLIGGINEYIPWEMPFWEQSLIGAAGVTAAELAAGYVLNVKLGMGIWDYSGMPLNLAGQICLPFSIAWYFLSGAAIILDDWLRYWMFAEEMPRYRMR